MLPCSCLRVLEEHLGKEQHLLIQLWGRVRVTCHIPGTNPGCRARETMFFYADDMRSIVGEQRGSF